VLLEQDIHNASWEVKNQAQPRLDL